VASRTLTTVADTATVTLPSDFKAVVALFHDSDAMRGKIELVPRDKLAEFKEMYGTSGIPTMASIVGSSLYLAPVPDDSYSLLLDYEVSLPSLSATQTSNWLLAAHPDVYLFASLAEAAPYLWEDERVQVWGAKLEKAIEEVAKANERAEFTGRLVIRPTYPLGA
jgi:hypothetical protein